MKKAFYKKWWFWLIVVLLVIGVIGTISGSDNSEKKPSSEDGDTASTASIILSADELGKYGREITLNKGTDTEYTYIGFFIPAGNYKVSNNNSSGGAQVSIYKDEISIVDQQEEPSTDGCPAPIVLMAGDTKELTITDGQYVKLADGDSNIEFVLVG